MPSGFQAWNADGSIQIDTNTRTSRTIGSLALAADPGVATKTGQFTVPKAAGERLWLAGAAANCFLSATIYNTASGTFAPDPNGNAIYWVIYHPSLSESGGTGIIYYGVF